MPSKLWDNVELLQGTLVTSEGVMYAMKMSPDRINVHREAVASALEEMGVTITTDGINLIIGGGHGDINRNSVSALLEELSALNIARKYHSQKIDSMEKMHDNLARAWYTARAQGAYELANHLLNPIALNAVGILKALDNESRVFNSKQRADLNNLAGIVWNMCADEDGAVTTPAPRARLFRSVLYAPALPGYSAIALGK